MRFRLSLLAFFMLLSLSTAQANQILRLNINGGIGPATADYIDRGIQAGQNSQAILIIMNTPGGLDKSMRQIIKAILSSDVPIITYVAPNGARAASAGTYILYASTIAAMAPSTHLGAASPVSLTGGMGPANKKKEQDGNTQSSTLAKKANNDAIAYLRSLAQLRNRDTKFAEKAITEAATLTAKEALQQGVIDLVSDNQSQLLNALNGKSVSQNGQEITLATQPSVIEDFKPDWRMKLLLIITEPTVAYLLLLLGVYGIFFELFHPGAIIPGVIGGVSMLIALYALQLLPISYAGLGLILLGIAFIIAEIFTPSFGILGIGGTIAFIVGSIMLMDTNLKAYQIAFPAILGMAAANVVILFTFLSMILRSRKRQALNSSDRLINQTGIAMEDFDKMGQIKIGGEIWQAKTDTPVKSQDELLIQSVDGLTLNVKPKKIQ